MPPGASLLSPSPHHASPPGPSTPCLPEVHLGLNTCPAHCVPCLEALLLASGDPEPVQGTILDPPRIPATSTTSSQGPPAPHEGPKAGPSLPTLVPGQATGSVGWANSYQALSIKVSATSPPHTLTGMEKLRATGAGRWPRTKQQHKAVPRSLRVGQGML